MVSLSDKLNLLSRTFNISNSRLAKALCVDTSLISRWRRGSRIPGKNSQYIKSIATYFAGHAEMNYQKVALFELMGLQYDENSSCTDYLVNALETWLTSGTGKSETGVNGFLEGLSMFRASMHRELPETIEGKQTEGQQVKTEVFYGTNGKREGVIRFLTAVAAQAKPCTLLLYSDENMDWLTADRNFYIRWGMLLGKLIANGCTIKIVHTITRDLSEMLQAIERWLPLYITGAIEPYYYPKYYEGIFKRTMFIAPEIAALTAESISEQTELGENLFHTDKKILMGLTEKYMMYLSNCRPLMRIMTAGSNSGMYELITEFNEQPADTIYLADSPPFVTMSEALYSEFLQRSGFEEETKRKLKIMQQARVKSFEENIKRHTFTMLFSLPELADILAGKVPVPFSCLFGNQTVFYTPAEYAAHIEHVVKLMKSEKNLKCYICSDNEKNINVTAKMEVGVMIAKSSVPLAIFAFNHPSMTNSFYTYLEGEKEKIPRRERTDQFVVRKLNALIQQLTAE